jgi:DNA-binding SARP family transcriptional activator
VDLPRFIALGHLIVCGDAEDRETAYEHALAAVESARRYKAPFLETLAAIALAEVGPAAGRAGTLAQARQFAANVESEPLQRVVAAVEEGGDTGFLTTFLKRLRRDRRNDRNTVVIELVNGRVRRGETFISLPERELTLLLACALRPEAFTRERLTDLLWPDLAESAARNAFHVCMHRLKQHLQDDDVIIRTKDGYRLRNDVRVDLWEIDRSMSALRTSETLAPESMAALRELFERLAAERPARFANWEWFEQTERRLRELRSEVAHTLAKDALSRGRHTDALAMSRQMIDHDPCDEPAREIAISAYLASGDRAAALRHFRQYRDTLRDELDCEPSETLAKLVGAV